MGKGSALHLGCEHVNGGVERRAHGGGHIHGVVDEDIHCAIGLNSVFDGSTDLIRLGHIAGNADGLAARSTDFIHHFLHRLIGARQYRHLCAFSGKALCHRTPDAAAGAGDNGNLVFKSSHDSYLFSLLLLCIPGNALQALAVTRY